ncbi:MAG: hypothetical protein EA426_00455 [Spirochaetaceae bacterium]|nr:MAG: hypothetical protein EA426_00455 [Spirochaetaceae bacterium]
MQKKHEVTYFETGGAEHTDAALDAAFATVSELGLSYLVVASGGKTVLAAAQRAAATGRTDVKVVGVTLQAGTWAQYGEPDWSAVREARGLGADVITCTHSLMGNVESAIRAKFGGMPPVELIAHTLYMFSQGTKVAVEIVLSAVDAGVVPAGTDVVSVAGTGGGADTAYVITAASTVDFFDLRVKRMICKPL